MEFKGTKGKWYLQEFTDVYTNIVRSDQGKGFETIFITNLHGNSKGNKNRYDALLISKAPEMLDMLKDIANELESGEAPHVYKIHQLIKEATELK